MTYHTTNTDNPIDFPDLDDHQLSRIAFAEGYDEAFNGSGENYNPYDELTQYDQWAGYENGYTRGLEKLMEDCQ